MTTEPKIKESLCKRLLVAAIDFGTTYSGFAFSFRKEPYNIKRNVIWNARAPLQTMKTPTVLLLDENKQFVAFGYEAEERYEQLVDNGTHKNYYYCRRFKMSLHTSVIMDINYTIKDLNGKKVEALIVFSESIKYLKKETEELINKRCYFRKNLGSNDIEWVLTVPAIWTDAAKQIMRKAAEKAGIKDDNLKIALEPEAASVLYMHLNCIQTDETARTDRGFQSGDKYLVVDMGGVTVDITLHQVVDATSLRELVPPCGGHWGGTTVDDNYVRLVKGIVENDVFNSMVEKDHDSLIYLYREFEIKKRAFKHDCTDFQDKRTTHIPISGALIDRLKEMYPTRNINDDIERDDTLRGKVTWKRSKLTITSGLFASFFETSLKGTIDVIERILRISADVDAILLVGGFAESPLIQQRVKSRFLDKRVIVPEDAGLAILKGAVLYGHFPNIIVSRVARHSYGIRVYRDFIPGQDPVDKLVVIGTKRICKDVFVVHVKKGQELRVGEVQSSKRYTRLSLAQISLRVGEAQSLQLYTRTRLERGQKSLIFDFFSSTSKNPEYVTDDGCEQLGQLEIELDSRSTGVVISLKYGGTEMEAEGLDEVTGKRTTAIFKFLKE